MNERQIIAQLVDLLPSGALGVLIFYSPMLAAFAWAASLLFRRKPSVVEIIALVAFWSVLLAFYGFLIFLELQAISD